MSHTSFFTDSTRAKASPIWLDVALLWPETWCSRARTQLPGCNLWLRFCSQVSRVPQIFQMQWDYFDRKRNQSKFTNVPCCLVTKSCPTLCHPMNYSSPGFPVLHHLPELAQTHVHWASDAIQPSHPQSPLLLPSVFPIIRVFSNKLTFHIRWPSIGTSTSASVLPINIQGWFPLGWTGLIPCCPEDESSPTFSFLILLHFIYMFFIEV